MGIFPLIKQNIIRNRRTLLVSSIGLVVGIAALVFFVALGAGVKRVVLEDLFAIRQLEVVPRQYDFGFTRFSIAKLNENAVAQLEDIPHVDAVYPKMKWTFPAWATGGKEILGRNFRAEVMADGISPQLATDLKEPQRFRDWDAEVACSGPGVGAEVGCPPAQQCIAGFCEKLPCNPKGPQNQCPAPTYCVEDTHTCDMPIPIVVHPSLLNAYNTGLTTALSSGTGVKLPKLTPDALVGFIFDVELGNSYLGEAKQGEPRKRKMQCVGVSSRAIPLGFTMPISYVRRFNAYFTGESESHTYHSIVLEAHSNSDVAGITQAVRKLGYELDSGHAQADRIGLMISIVTLLFSLISLLIVTISAINIAQTFFMIIAERRLELGVMRALGASRGHIARMILGEGIIVGIIGGGAGVLFAFAGIAGVNFAIVKLLPDLPVQASSFFDVTPLLVLGALFCGILFCLAGCARPAYRASHLDPVRAFRGD